MQTAEPHAASGNRYLLHASGVRRIRRVARVISPVSRLWIVTAIVALLLLPQTNAAGRIRSLIVGMVNGRSAVEEYFSEEPAIQFTSVPCRYGVVPGDMAQQMKYIRQYYPRTLDEMRTYDFIMLHSPEYYLLTVDQDRWIHDRIAEGAGGWSDGSVFSIVSQIHDSWAISTAQRAFPNDAPAVVARGGGGESPVDALRVVINRNFPDPVLTIFLPYRVENYPGYTSRYIIPRQSAGIMAYQVGNFPGHGQVPFLVAWDYEKGRTITCGGFIYPNGWYGHENPYGADIVMNMVFYATDRKLIEDVDVFHALKGSFRQFGNRRSYLMSLADFVDRLGGNTLRIQKMVLELDGMRSGANEKYLDGDFGGCQEVLARAFEEFVRAEAVAKEVKDAAMRWVYLVEWMATTSVLFISGFTVWTLMVRRRLYRAVRTTKLVADSPGEG